MAFVLAPFRATHIRPASHPCVLLSSVAGLPVPQLLCWLRAPGLQVHSLSAHYRWARERERAHVSPFSGLIKVFSCSSPYFFLSPPFSLVLTPHRSHPSSFDLQYLHHPPVPIVAMGNLRNAPPPPRCPRCIEHPAKCEPISGGGWSAKPQSTSCRWQPSLRWL